MPTNLNRELGKEVFGSNAEGYLNGRPEYPARVYEILADAFQINQNTKAFEIGAGTGQATAKLLDMGCQVSAIEPNANLSKILEKRYLNETDQLKIFRQTFEDVELPRSKFDLGIAATSMHWLATDKTYQLVFDLLKSNGKWAMWWTLFQNPNNLDKFQLRTRKLFDNLQRSPSVGCKPNVPFALDQEERTAELKKAGFVDICYEEIPWKIKQNKRQAIDLISTFSQVASLELKPKRCLLNDIGKIIDDEFDGKIERHFLTVVYTAKKPKHTKA